jgi:tRNA-splicing ligase RtcB
LLSVGVARLVEVVVTDVGRIALRDRDALANELEVDERPRDSVGEPDVSKEPVVSVDLGHHNYAAWEHHVGVNGIVHRKGAVRARAGETVLIPGSMGTASYVGEGLGNADAFETCQHGAGRAMSRTAARKPKTSDAVYAEMAELGVFLRSSEPKGVAEEAAFAYKDIESVVAASASLVRPTKRLTPLGVVKG